jgi:glucose/arabinose dehydrogenase
VSFLLVAVGLLVPTMAHAASPRRGEPRCEVGRFVLDEPIPFPDSPAGAFVLEIADRKVSIPGACEEHTLRTKRRDDGIHVRARWRRCAGEARRLRLRAVVDAETCRTLTGEVRAARPPLEHRFTAERALSVLLFSRTAGFRHASIADAHAMFRSLPPSERIATTITEDPSVFTDDALAAYDVVLFVNTTGDVLNPPQQGALERFVQGRKGFVGVHSAADTEYGWPWYGRLVGAYFRSHPLLPVTVEVTTEDRLHPSTSHLPATFLFTDEIYNFDRNPRLDNHVLLSIDEAGFTFPNFPPGPSMGVDHPVAWLKEFEGGRAFYTNLGHRPETWTDPAFRRHLLEGIRWAARPNTWSRQVVTDVARNPMAMAVTPTGDLYHVERTGEVYLWRLATGRSTEAARLDVDTAFENGLLGITLDPSFATNRRVYLYHSEPIPDPPPASGPPGENVLSRFVARADGTLDPGSRVDLLRVPSERQCCHEGGSLAFAPDGTLFLSTGDNTNPFDAQGAAPLDERPGRETFDSRRTAGNPFDLRGAILRIHPDGSIPAGNLYPADGSAGRPEIFVKGTRNPFRIAVDPVTGRLAWGDVGPDAIVDGRRGPRGYDEINVADEPGVYGWPFCIADGKPYADYSYATDSVSGAFTCDGTVPAPLFYDYITTSHLPLGNVFFSEDQPFTGRLAIAGTYARPVPGSPFALPPPFVDTLLMTEWTRDLLLAVDVDAAGALQGLSRLVPWEDFRRPIDLEIAPDGALYVLEYGTDYFGDNVDARVSRIEHSEAGALTPIAVVGATPTAGSAPLVVTLSGLASYAPGSDDEIVRYEWDLDGDGRVDDRRPAFTRRFTRPGEYHVTLTVVGSSGRRSIPSVRRIVAGNAPPTVTITSPTGAFVTAPPGPITIHGTASDPEDGTAPCNDLVWDVRLGHNAHSHPQTTTRGCSVTFDATLPGHGDQRGLFWAVELRYEDRGGPGGEPALTGRDSVRVEVSG